MDSSFVTDASRIMLSAKEVLSCHLLFLRKMTFVAPTWASCIDQNAAKFIGITLVAEGCNSSKRFIILTDMGDL